MSFENSHLPGATRRPGAREMTALLALLMALNAFAIDAMIPALPDIGRSLHVVMAYSADGVGSRVARSLQSEWARSGLDVELRPFREPVVNGELLRRGGAQLLLVEDQAILANPSAELASLVLPMRGPPVGAFRAGWMTREFDPWIWGQGNPPPLDVAAAQQRMVDEDIVLPIANLPWLWVQRASAQGRFHPRFGPDPCGAAP